jgi:hypothetical protein
LTCGALRPRPEWKTGAVCKDSPRAARGKITSRPAAGGWPPRPAACRRFVLSRSRPLLLRSGALSTAAPVVPPPRLHLPSPFLGCVFFSRWSAWLLAAWRCVLTTFFYHPVNSFNLDGLRRLRRYVVLLPLSKGGVYVLALGAGWAKECRCKVTGDVLDVEGNMT